MRRPVTWLLGAAFALFLIGVAVIALTAPVFTHYVALKTSLTSEAGLPQASMLQVAEAVRKFVTDIEAPPLPAIVDGRAGFDPGAVAHLVDVRTVLSGARVVTGLLAAVLAVAIGFEVARKRTDLLADGLFAGAIITVVFVALAVVAGTMNFDAFFSAFHGLFFKAGTWTFPYDSLLIETFPESFWMTAGVAWGALALLGAGAMTVVGRALRRGNRGREGRVA